MRRRQKWLRFRLFRAEHFSLFFRLNRSNHLETISINFQQLKNYSKHKNSNLHSILCLKKNLCRIKVSTMKMSSQVKLLPQHSTHICSIKQAKEMKITKATMSYQIYGIFLHLFMMRVEEEKIYANSFSSFFIFMSRGAFHFYFS